MSVAVSQRLGERLLERLTEFCRRIKEEGIDNGTSEVIDAAKALACVDMGSADQFYLALRCTLVKRAEHISLFDKLFKQFWLGRSAGEKAPERPIAMRPTGEQASGSYGARPPSAYLWGPQLTYSPHEVLGRRRFRPATPAELHTLRRHIRRLTRELASLPGKGFRSSRKGSLDLRRTARANLGRAGELIALRKRRRKETKARIVLLCDVSGSMNEYSERLLVLMHQFCNLVRARVFVFSTRLVGVNGLLEGKSLQRASELISERVSIWNSGTRIAEALRSLMRGHRELLCEDTALLVVSDALDLGDEAELDEALRQARRSVGTLLWFNPLADAASYKPITSGAMAVLRHASLMCGFEVFWDSSKFRSLLRSIRVRLAGSLGP